MQVLVSDSSILIELAKWSLLKEIFQLPFEFIIPDALYEDELINLGATSREQLIEYGLRVEALDPAQMAQASAYSDTNLRLTIHDCFAVTLALTNNWPLLTGDKRMRALAEKERIETHGVLWIIDLLVSHGVTHKSAMTKVLRGMLTDSTTRLPPAEINKRLMLFAQE